MRSSLAGVPQHALGGDRIVLADDQAAWDCTCAALHDASMAVQQHRLDSSVSEKRRQEANTHQIIRNRDNVHGSLFVV
jgi:hypothetical protein